MTKAIGSVFELAMRYLLVLNSSGRKALTESRICAEDFICTYAADFGLADENLNGNSGYRYGEYASRCSLANDAIRYGFDVLHKIQEKLSEILKAIQFPGAASARLNDATFDIEISGKQKANVMGGGFCGILNTVVLLAIREVLYKDGKYTPGILMLDSALTQLSESQYGEKANVIRDSFIKYLLEHQEFGQIIFIDQKEKNAFLAWPKCEL